MDYRCGARRPECRNERQINRNPNSSVGEQNSCCKNGMFSNYPLGMAYVPRQKFINLYDWETGFSQGTIFTELDKPFMAASCMGRCRR